MTVVYCLDRRLTKTIEEVVCGLNGISGWVKVWMWVFGSKTLLMKLHPLLIIYTDFIITFFINNTPRDNADYCTCVGFG